MSGWHCRFLVGVVAVAVGMPGLLDPVGVIAPGSSAEAKRKRRRKGKKKRTRRKKRKRAANLRNFKRVVENYLKYHVRRGGDAGKLLATKRARWTRMACKKLQGNPTDQCASWYEQINMKLLYKYRPGARRLVEIAENAGKKALAADRKAREELKRRRKKRCHRSESAVVDDRTGRTLFCGLKDLLHGPKVKLSVWVKERGWGAVPSRFRPAGAKTSPGPIATSDVSAQKEARAMAKYRSCPYTAKQISGALHESLERRFRGEAILACQDIILQRYHYLVRRTVWNFRHLWARTMRSDHFMHAARNAFYKSKLETIRARLRMLTSRLQLAEKIPRAKRIAFYQDILRDLERIRGMKKTLDRIDQRAMSGTNVWADRFERAARFAQKVMIKTIGGLVFIASGGNIVAKCLTESLFSTAADKAEKWYVKEKTVTISGVSSTLAKKAALNCALAAVLPTSLPTSGTAGGLQAVVRTAATEAVKSELIQEGAKQGTCRAAFPLAFSALINRNSVKSLQSLRRSIAKALDTLGQAVTGRSVRATMPGGLKRFLTGLTDAMIRAGVARFRQQVRSRCLGLGCSLGEGWGRILGRAASCLLGAAKRAFKSAGVEGIRYALVRAIEAARRGLRHLVGQFYRLARRYERRYPALRRVRITVGGLDQGGADLFLRMARACPAKFTDDLRASAPRVMACLKRAARSAWQVTLRARRAKRRGRR